jgi:hypothetical protein
LQDLAYAHMQTLETCNAYNFSTYKNSFIGSNGEVRDFAQRLIAEEAAPLPVAGNLTFKQRKSDRYFTERFSEMRVFLKKKTQDEVPQEGEEHKENTLLGIKIPTNQFQALTLCSDFRFLYKIAKIAMKHSISVQDGMCAIKDYVELLRLERDKGVKEVMGEKAEKIRRALEEMIKIDEKAFG